MTEERSGLPERTRPECVVLGVRPGAAASPKPPVRIYLGTEASQFRPERVLVWSIEQVRDPGRVYQIFLMKELAGFDRRRWTTGFTNYRFAIPYFAKGAGRAIYNDEDQIYLTDPGELFDLDMGDRGFLAISEAESSVMLVDCARMLEVWPIEAARSQAKKALLKRAVERNLFGPLAAEWNAREEEYAAGRSHLLHYTTLHTQPWRPFPDRFVYRENPLGGLWHELERSADRNRFQLFSRERPSSRFRLAGPAPASDRAAAELLSETEAQLDELPVRSVARWDPMRADRVDPADAVVCCRGLEDAPEDDVPWLLDELFAAADRFVVAGVDCGKLPASPAATATETLTAPERWPEHFSAAGARHPGIRWQLVVRHPGSHRPGACQYYRGGPRHDANPPRVRLLVDPRSRFAESAESLAAALGWPWDRVVGREREPTEPWPELLICAGSRVAARAARIRSRSRGRTRVVLLGERAQRAAGLDLVVAPVSAQLFPDPRRVEVAAPLVAARAEERRRACQPWRKLFAEAAAPRIALLVDESPRRLTAAVLERLGRGASEFAAAQGGSIFGLVSPRLSSSAASTLSVALGQSQVGELERADDPYLAHLELADAFIVTGDAEWILADVCTTGKPVHIFPLPEPRGVIDRLRGAVVRLADASPSNNRGTTRPQKGLERFCSRLIAKGTIRPPKSSRAACEALIAGGCARWLGDPGPAEPRPLREAERVAERVRRLLGAG